MSYAYEYLSDAEKQTIEVSLSGGVGKVSPKLLRALEADLYARTLLGLSTASSEVRLKDMKKSAGAP